MIDLPLMSNNISREDVDSLINFLQTSDRFTQSGKVREFEETWGNWLTRNVNPTHSRGGGLSVCKFRFFGKLHNSSCACRNLRQGRSYSFSSRLVKYCRRSHERGTYSYFCRCKFGKSFNERRSNFE